MNTWTPDIPDLPLCVSVKAVALEETCSKLWSEFLTGYFDGNRHGDYDYPKVNAGDIIFQQNKPNQEIEGVALHVVTLMDQVHKTRRFGKGFSLFDGLKWEIYVKAAITKAREDGLTADGLSQRTADSLYALLTRPGGTLPLNRAGLMSIRCSPPKFIPSTAYYARRLLIRASAKAAI